MLLTIAYVLLLRVGVGDGTVAGELKRPRVSIVAVALRGRGVELIEEVVFVVVGTLFGMRKRGGRICSWRRGIGRHVGVWVNVGDGWAC
jgi:hypothetical protein